MYRQHAWFGTKKFSGFDSHQPDNYDILKIMGSRDLTSVKCYHCKNIFLRPKFRIQENKKLKHNHFCSKDCLIKSKITSIDLICENSLCGKPFRRAPHSISKCNYCSQSCAAIVNNKKYPKWNKPPKICAYCKREFKGYGKLYCSIACKHGSQRPYTNESLIEDVKLLAKNLGRVPSKRDNSHLST